MGNYYDPAKECASREQIKEWQDEHLAETVKKVYENVDYYREKMQAAGIEPGDIRSTDDLHLLPFLTKEDLRNTYPYGMAAEFFRRGLYPAHRENLCRLYRGRRDAMLKALDAYFPAGTKHTMPDGGYYVWVELPEGLDAAAMVSVL